MANIIRREPFEGLLRWNPFGSPWNWDLEDVFEDFMESPREGMLEVWKPAVESYQKNGSYVIKADLPGVDPKNVHLTVEGNCLTIQGERKMDKEIKEKGIEGREIYYGSFSRSMPVPRGVKVEAMKAKYHDGVLEITAPVDEKYLPKKVEVEVQKA